MCPKITEIYHSMQEIVVLLITIDALKSSLRMPVTFQVSADISTELVLNIQSTLYRYKLCEGIKIFLLNLPNDEIKKKQDVDNDLHTLLNSFFQPNLTNGTLKESQEDPLILQ